MSNARIASIGFSCGFCLIAWLDVAFGPMKDGKWIMPFFTAAYAVAFHGDRKP